MKRQGLSMIEVMVVLLMLGIMSGTIWNAVDSTERVKLDREIWRDVEIVSSAVRTYRIEKGTFPVSLEFLEAHGYIGRLLPPPGFIYIVSVNGTGRRVYAASSENPSEIRKDLSGREFKVDVE